jgi:poly(hydroxyalkanoate) granule-associated protein
MAEETITAESVADRAKKVATDAQTAAVDTATTMTAAVRRVLLAAVGAVALTKDEIEDFVGKLVERGEIAEQDGRKLVKDVLARRHTETERVTEQVTEQFGKAESVLDERIESILARLNVPTKSDIDALSEKISSLAAKVDALKN